jgi:hypothetical protein
VRPKVARSVEGAGGTGRFPRREILGARADLGGAWAEACLQEGGPRGKHGFPRATEPQAREAA